MSTEALQQLELFASQNQWSAVGSQTLSNKILESLKSYDGKNLLSILLHSQEAVEPGLLLIVYIPHFSTILLSCKELDKVEQTLQIIKKAFNTYVPPGSEHEKRLTDAALKILDIYVTEAQKRWSTLKDISAGIQQVDVSVSLDPAHIPRLEQALFSFGMAHPVIFYDLLHSLSMDPQARIYIFLLLKSFLTLKDAPTYYLIDSELHRTVMKSGLYDTEFGLFITALTILTIMLPLVAVKATNDIEILLGILQNAFRWEYGFEKMIRNQTPDSRSIGIINLTEDLDNILNRYSIESVKRVVEQYFTMLYGMFPANVFVFISTIFREEQMNELPQEKHGFVKAQDDLQHAREELLKGVAPIDYQIRVQVFVIKLGNIQPTSD
jgi:hypothetical protein